MNDMNITIEDLKYAIKDLPDDMPVIIAISDEDNLNIINRFVHARTIGVLSSENETQPALCINSSEGGLDIKTQIIALNCGVKCLKILC